MMKALLRGTALVTLLAAVPAAAQLPGASLPTYQDSSKSPQDRAADLVGRMTLEEKATQLINDAAAIPRLNVREYNWWNEGLHGVAAAGYATVFPQAVGMAATFDAPHIGDVGTLISKEFRAKYLDKRHRFGGSDWFAGLTVWSPNINIFRDPRWGRGQETYGEDPYLTARMGVAFVKGLQGDDSTYFRTIATPKHYAVHSGPEASRHRDDIHPSQRDLVDTYLPAFRATVTEANAQSIMCAYNAINGLPACASAPLMTHYLRDRWKFDGYVVSDCEAVADIYLPNNHGYTKTPEEGVTAAFNAGMDLICGGAKETDHIIAAVKKGLLAQETIDRSLIRLFTARIKLGQFDPDGKAFPEITAKDFDTESNRALSLVTAEKALVLLKNNGVLPLAAAPKRIAVIGPNADNILSLVGNYNGDPSHPVTILSGLKRRFPDAVIDHVEGAGLIERGLLPVPASQLCIDAACRTPGVTVESFASRDLTGKPLSSTTSAEARLDWSGVLKSGATRYTGYLKAPESGSYSFRYLADGGYRVFIDDKSVVDAWQVDWRPSIVSGTVTLEAGRTYKLRVEAFQRQTEGKEALVWSPPSDPAGTAAVAAARNADLVVFAAGLTSQLEGEEMRMTVPGFAGGDRTFIDLPAVQQSLLEKVNAAGKPVVLVLVNGSALSVNWAQDNVAAILEAWYPGGQGGDAVARAIAGDVNPAGRLPVTFYRSVNDLPPFLDYGMKNRTYRYFDKPVLYPFGYGLSYTSFGYAGLKVARPQVRAADGANVSVRVTNTGKRDGDEVVQLYLSRPDIAGSPVRWLAGFQRVTLKAGESRTVNFRLDPRILSTVADDGSRSVTPGTMKLWVGGGQDGARPDGSATPGLSGQFRISGSLILPD